jgi:Tol biopolymer transport system component
MKRAQLFTALLSIVAVIVTSGCPTDNTNGTGDEPEIIDLCDGQKEFLAIPEGADIIFTASLYADNTNSPSEIYVIDIDEQTLYRVSCSNLSGPACDYARPDVAPDGTKMVVMRGCSDTNGDGVISFQDKKGIWIIDMDDGTASEVEGLTNVNSPGWSANNEIVFAASLPGNLNTDIYTMDEDGANIENLTNTDDRLENDPCWSHDGEQIAFVKGEFVTPEGLPDGSFIAARGDLWVMDGDGTNQTKVVSFAGDEDCPDYADNFCLGLPADPAFLPDGEDIVFERLLSTAENGGSGRWNIFSASLSGLDQSITNLTNDSTAYQTIPRTSQRGIVFHEVDIDKPFYGLVMTDLDGTNREPILDNSTWEYYLGAATWLPQ